MTRSALPRVDCELIFIRMALMHRAGYILHNHHDGAEKFGLTSEQMQALQTGPCPRTFFAAPAQHSGPRRCRWTAGSGRWCVGAGGEIPSERRGNHRGARRDRPCLHRLLHHRSAGYRTRRRALQSYGCSQVRTQSVKRVFAVEAMIIPRWTYWQSITTKAHQTMMVRWRDSLWLSFH